METLKENEILLSQFAQNVVEAHFKENEILLSQFVQNVVEAHFLRNITG